MNHSISSATRSGKVPAKLVGGAVGVIVILIVVSAVAGGLVTKNDDANWQIHQSVTGTVTIIDTPGWYLKMFGTVWTWPRAHQAYFSASPEEGGSKDQSIRVTFNDGGTAQISSMVRYQLPVETDMRRRVHREFGGQVDNVTQAIRSHLINCLKSTAPLMSSSEHQSARKSEFVQLVEQQLRKGVFKTRKVERVLKDQFDETGKPITVFATEIVADANGMPEIAQQSPLVEFGLTISQFSITETQYDPATLKQFAAKKESFLAAEKSKAEREQEVQQRLMIVERGLRERAEVEAIANKEKAKELIAAQKRVELEAQAKLEAETKAQKEAEVARIEAEKRREVAEIEKLEALIKANKELEVATLQAQAAAKEAEAIRVLAEAEEQKIKLGGAITEKERVLAEIAMQRDSLVAEHLTNISVPKIMIVGGDGQNGSGGLAGVTPNLINLWLMKQNGLLPAADLATTGD